MPRETPKIRRNQKTGALEQVGLEPYLLEMRLKNPQNGQDQEDCH
jgi:hypothetical protein